LYVYFFYWNRQKSLLRKSRESTLRCWSSLKKEGVLWFFTSGARMIVLPASAEVISVEEESKSGWN